VVTFSPLKLRVKTLDHRGLDNGDTVRHFPLGASSWSSELPGLVLVSLWQVLVIRVL
jgi:hypothetical protein